MTSKNYPTHSDGPWWLPEWKSERLQQTRAKTIEDRKRRQERLKERAKNRYPPRKRP